MCFPLSRPRDAGQADSRKLMGTLIGKENILTVPALRHLLLLSAGPPYCRCLAFSSFPLSLTANLACCNRMANPNAWCSGSVRVPFWFPVESIVLFFLSFPYFSIANWTDSFAPLSWPVVGLALDQTNNQPIAYSLHTISHYRILFTNNFFTRTALE